MAVYITGDTHGEISRFCNFCFPEQKTFSKDEKNYLIVLGDFGFIWDKETSAIEKYNFRELSRRKFTILFIDGNHENFDRLYSDEFPIVENDLGRMQQVLPNVFHLLRGHVYNIEGHLFWVMGGARSHDIKDGILDLTNETDILKYKIWKKDYFKLFRINHLSWWKEEMPSAEEMAFGLESLKQHDYKVDFILSHDCPASDAVLMYHNNVELDELNMYLENIRSTVDYTRWYFGHHHINKAINDKDIALYEKVERII